MIVPTALMITMTALLAGASAQIMPELILDDGRGLRAYTVACDELHCRPVRGTDHPLKIRALDNMAATASYAAEQESREESRFDLVLYEAGKPRIARFRRSLSRRILVTMDGTLPADAIARAAQAKSF